VNIQFVYSVLGVSSCFQQWYLCDNWSIDD
jgi:hypothetical protein